MQKLYEDGEIKDCPVCKAPTYRYEGCNYMTCSSPQCQGKTNFCNLCGEQLSKIQHATHFTGFSPYSKTCDNTKNKEKKKEDKKVEE